ncbi:aminopeptidase P family protein [Leifsonia sp. H3M29-4]|uniref:aminopeptidase P family protein n=1 Tax=Salinibacterium metalliresistens TaxID=3031321 RepID=UPI0023D9A5ED|nr:aminopeptidase P family protein [Salinibacterium metalliresistens]MDF1479531.1 aminopeptidase P family protein [Salinibacterium metalliresistens]
MAESEAEAPKATTNRSTLPQSDRFADYIGSNWAELDEPLPPMREHARYAAERRARISAKYPGKRLILPAGDLKTRSNDTEYPYRAHSAFAHLTGWGSDTVAGSVLVLEPTATGHDAVLYFRETAPRGTSEFYANPTIGEFWQGRRPSLDHVAADLGIATRSLADLPELLEAVDATTLLVRDADRDLTDQIDGRRLLVADSEALEVEGDDELARDLSELRLTKDAFEIAEMRAAIAATQHGFDDVIADLPNVIAHRRGERIVEGTFNRRARADGNTVGYDTIAASGPHACILHWTRNDGPVVPGDLILIDAGVEVDSYYTADITRTLPVSGTFSEVQRRVYEAVREAADAAFAIVKPGIVFREVHAAAMKVIAAKTAEWGLLPVSAEESLEPDGQYHRRYMVHGTSHHLGIDVHDCGQARREFYADGIVQPGMVFTIEPGLYFQLDDLTVPEEYRGIGVRIEDDILVTETGAENLSAGIPRTADEVEEWMARAR